MSGFDAGWLALRAPADARARNADLARQVAAHMQGGPAPAILDLGAGTGNNMAALVPLLPAGQRWRLVDSAPDLLARAAPPPGVHASRVCADLARDLEGLFAPRPDLVTASALFDLGGADWIDRLVGLLARQCCPLYAVLTYDGRARWVPAHPLDAAALDAFHANQRRDKGLGPALGPDAHAYLAARLAEAGYTVVEGASDWRLAAPCDAALIAALAEGVAAAIRSRLGERADAWLAARRRAEAAWIGHRDLLALPAETRAD